MLISEKRVGGMILFCTSVLALCGKKTISQFKFIFPGSKHEFKPRAPIRSLMKIVGKLKGRIDVGFFKCSVLLFLYQYG